MQQGMNLEQLLTEVKRMEDVKRDIVVDGRRALHFEERPSLDTKENGAGFGINVRHGGGEEHFALTETAHNQLAGRLDIPRKFYDRLRKTQPDLLRDNVNTLLEREGRRYMVRTLDDDARAFLSDRYHRLDNGPVLAQTLPAIIKGDFETQLLGSNVHHDRMDLKILFTDDRFAQEITARTRDGSPRVVRPGFRLSNSETGLGSLRVEAFFFDSYCLNGCVFGTTEIFSYRRAHIGSKLGLGEMDIISQETMRAEDAAIMSSVKDMMGKIADPDFAHRMGERLRAAASTPQAQDPMAAVEEAVTMLPLHDGEKTSILETFLRDGDYSQWGLASAVTSVANREKTSWDRACELENIGGKILNLAPREWKRIAEAEPVAAVA